MQAALQQSQETTSYTVPLVNDPMTKNDLLLLATKRFCDSESHDFLSLDQYKEAFYLLINSVSVLTKQRISELISTCVNTPRAITIYFSLEPLTVSTPVLRSSEALGQLDLLRIVEMKGVDHAAIIATRHDIGPSLVQRLKSFNNSDVNAALSANYALTGEVAEQTQDADTLYDGITGQNETKVEQGQTTAETALLKAASRGGRIQSKIEDKQPQNLPIKDLGSAFEGLSRTRSHQALAVLMQKQAGLHPETAHKILADESGDTLAVFLRSADVDDAQANRIQLLIQPAIGLSVQNATRAIKFYAQLKTDTCQQAVDQWPKIKGHGIEHQSYLEEGKPVRQTTSDGRSIGISQGEEELRNTG